jgi:hypothetical protein
MDLHSLPRRYPVAYASPGDFAKNTIRILARLGYEILSPEGFEKVRGGVAGDTALRPDVFLVDEARLSELPVDDLPVLVLARSEVVTDADSRIVGVMKPPVGMHDLYRLLQQVLEDRPRSTPRIRTELAGLCHHAGRQWKARVVSLSENGCLLRSPEPVPLGTRVQLAFEVPGSSSVHIDAEAAYQLLPDVGLVFSSIAPRIRELIAGYVAESLLRADPAEPCLSQ